MQSAPDGIEVVQSVAADTASSPLLVIDAITAYLDGEGLGAGPLSWERIGEGQSNVTYLLERGGHRFVLRRGPRPPLPPSAHDMAREARIQRALAAAGVRVPEILAVCTDESVLGVPFYVMTHVDGVVITDRTPSRFADTQSRRRLSEATVDQLVALHGLDVTTGELAALGRPDGYLQRQVERFAGLWEANTTRSLPEVVRIAEWLHDNLPVSPAPAVVHGDYRLGNLMFRTDAPEVAAVLDWEMATLGDPLADLGYLAATYAEDGSTPTPLELTPVTGEPGYLDRAGLIARYEAQTGLDTSGLGWYQCLALWKAAIFSEAIYTRWLRGERPGDSFGPTLEAGIPTLLRQASAFAGDQPMTEPVVEVRPYRDDDLAALIGISHRIPRFGVDPLSDPRLADLVAAFFVRASLVAGASVTSVIEVDGVVRGSCLGTPDRTIQARDGAGLVARFRDLPAELDDPAQRSLALGLLQPPPGVDRQREDLPAGLHTEIDPDLQGVGAGGRVVQATVDLLRAAGVAGIYLAALPEGTHQRRFYERLGFSGVAGEEDVVGMRFAQS